MTSERDVCEHCAAVSDDPPPAECTVVWVDESGERSSRSYRVCLACSRAGHPEGPGYEVESCRQCGVADDLMRTDETEREVCALCVLDDDLGKLHAELLRSGIVPSPVEQEHLQSVSQSYRRSMSIGERAAAYCYGLGLQRLYYHALYGS